MGRAEPAAVFGEATPLLETAISFCKVLGGR
jgi:hypothetical protein